MSPRELDTAAVLSRLRIMRDGYGRYVKTVARRLAEAGAG